MNIPTNRDGRIHLEKVRFSLENLGTFIDNPEGLFFSQPAFSAEVLLEECEVGLRSIGGTPELIVGGRLHCRGLDI